MDKKVNDLTLPPASEGLLKRYINKVLISAYNNIDVNFVCFKGAGALSHLKYLIKEKRKNVENYKNDRLFLYLDASVLSLEDSTFYKTSLSAVLTLFDQELKEVAKTELNKYLMQESLTFANFIELVNTLTYKLDYKFTFLVSNFNNVYIQGQTLKNPLDKLISLKEVNPMNTSFILISKGEFDSTDISRLKVMSSEFTQNVVWIGDLLFDYDSAQVSIGSQENRHGHILTKEFKEKIITLTRGDPATLKLVCMKAFVDRDFEQKVVESVSIEDIYNIIGQEELNIRYFKIIAGLKQKSLEVLTNIKQDKEVSLTEYLLKTNLVKKEIAINDSVRYILLNPLFQHFVNFHMQNVSETITSILVTQDKAIAGNLTGQEVLLYKLLLGKKGGLASKDEIAQTIWGQEWEQVYSDWAIDKLTSTLRTKLMALDYPKTLKSVKGKGLMLV